VLELDEEGIHDLRVCLRRIRVLCRELEKPPGSLGRALAALRAGAANLFHALGGLRDLDILCRELAAFVETGRVPEGLDPELSRWVDLERRRLSAGLADAVALFEAEVAGFQARTAQREDFLRGPSPELKSDGPRLRRRARRVLVALERAEKEPSDERLHRLRIRAKQLRYAVEGRSASRRPVRSSAGDRDVAALERRLKRLQDALGAIQDAAMVVGRLEGLTETGLLDPSAAEPARVAATDERERRRREFLDELATGRHDHLFGTVRRMARQSRPERST
jgi:CHAD domain-containing protein